MTARVLASLRPRAARLSRSSGMYAAESALRRNGFGPVVGVDEAGRGPCAGPLVVAAVALPATARIQGLADSKLLSESAREQVFAALRRSRAIDATVVYEAAEIDRRGVGVCNQEGMRRAAARVLAQVAGNPSLAYALTDGFTIRGMPCPSAAVIKGDRHVAAIAAAGVVAKVTRDRMMYRLHEIYPEYGFADHKGYGTAAHSAALERYGSCREHRMSYSNVPSGSR
ncbi:ribonuclease HII [Haloglycomyces albus]|uniref:ribonuclease HII n=1 Tax=Haloglycomyces albus TaxID=526067 RepID=UPI001FE1F367|nr:ribonuclease HII [Haloglycomyces albus]